MKKFWYLILAVTMMLSLDSCMTAEKHLQKFYDKGGVLKPVEREVLVYDTIVTSSGKDSIVERLIEIPCPEPEPPKTRWEVRFDNKRFKDSMKYMRRMRNDSLDHVIKVLKSNNALLSDSLTEARKIKKSEDKTNRTEIRKENKRSWLFWLGVIVGAIATLGLVYVFNRFKKVIFPEN